MTPAPARANRVQIGAVGREPLQTRRGVRDDRRQRLIDLVRDGGGELAQGRHAGHTGELGLRLAQGLRRVRALDGDRGQGRDPLDDVLLVIVGPAGLAGVEREGPQHFALR